MAKEAVDAKSEPPGAASVEEISEKILGAIWEHRLPPGTKLVEDKLAGVFGVSRTKIRLALAKLSHDGILTVEPNRGTFVSSPTVAQARQVFDARRVVESALIRSLCGTLTREQLARLRKNIAMEADARQRNDRRRRFHRRRRRRRGGAAAASIAMFLRSRASCSRVRVPHGLRISADSHDPACIERLPYSQKRHRRGSG